jgi:NAD(P)-dependent dehydrogenase (short-subunit alcohol dehydrogenase family)
MPDLTRARTLTLLRGLLAHQSDSEERPFFPPVLTKQDQAPDDAFQVPALEQGDDDADRQKLSDALGQSKPSAVVVDGQAYKVQAEAMVCGEMANRVALVTGAAGAIGYGCCVALLEAGALLAAGDLPGQRLDDFVADLEKDYPGRVIGVGMDVTSPEAVAEGFATIIETWGGLDAVVVNAGVAHVAKLTDLTLEDFQRLEKVNVEGALLTLAETGRVLIRQNIGGDIVVMSTKNVPCPGAGFGAYSATKAGCHQLGRIASLELAPHGVRVNMVAPDAVFSEGDHASGLWKTVGPGRMKARGLDEKGLQEYYQNRNLLKARVTGRHVGNAVLFFVTRKTPTTGATIPVDGGLPDATPR